MCPQPSHTKNQLLLMLGLLSLCAFQKVYITGGMILKQSMSALLGPVSQGCILWQDRLKGAQKPLELL